MALVSNPHSAYSPRLPWLGGIAGLLAGGAILYFWPQWNRTWLSLVPAPVSVYTRFLGVTLEEVPLITYGHQALLGFLMVLLAPGYGKSTLAAWMMHNPASSRRWPGEVFRAWVTKFGLLVMVFCNLFFLSRVPSGTLALYIFILQHISVAAAVASGVLLLRDARRLARTFDAQLADLRLLMILTLGFQTILPAQIALMSAQQPRSAPAPFYEKVKQAISEKIHSGVWRPHDRIPSEAELVAQFGFSRMTINRALRELTDEGLLVRLQGVGTFVAEPKGQSALFEVRSIAAEIVARHHQHRCEVLLLEETRADHIQATALSVPEGTRIFHSLMVHYENEVPVQIEDRCVNAAVVPDYLHQDYTATTPHDYLSLIAPLTEGEHIVEAVQATAEECALLHIHAHDPCLLIRRRTWSTTHIVSHARLLFPGSRYRLQGRFGS